MLLAENESVSYYAGLSCFSLTVSLSVGLLSSTRYISLVFFFYVHNFGCNFGGTKNSSLLVNPLNSDGHKCI